MKKSILIFCIISIFTLSLCSCGVQDTSVQITTTAETTSTEPCSTTNGFEGLDIDEILINTYNSEFINYLSANEYVRLCSKLSKLNAIPTQPINEHLSIAFQDNSTYNTVSETYLLVSNSGELIHKFKENYRAPEFMQIDNFLFIDDFSEEHNWSTKAIYSLDGVYLSYIKVYDQGYFTDFLNLGSGYHIIALGDSFEKYGSTENTSLSGKSTDFWLLNPEGKCYEMSIPYGYSSIHSSDFGKLSDGLFSYTYRYDSETYAFYYNKQGKIVIDLSEDKVNFSVTELGEFNKGIATIKIVGADGKNYKGSIDKTGAFVNEPISY